MWDHFAALLIAVSLHIQRPGRSADETFLSSQLKTCRGMEENGLESDALHHPN
jgi:hypothetical protein